MRILRKELEAYGYTDDPERFKEVIVDCMNGQARNWTVDELLIHPDEAHKLACVVRKKVQVELIPDHVILGTLLNMRRASGV